MSTAGNRNLRPYIECSDLFKIYKRAELEVVALRGLDLEVARGEIIAIVGPSGSGKSTLLNILSGLEAPSAGEVRVGGRDLLNISPKDLLTYRRLEVGFVWQATGRNLIPYLNAADNIQLPMAISGLPSTRRKARAMELLSQLGIEGLAHRRPHELSSGEQQRIAIGVALANSPPLLLADEPTGELDTANADRVFETFRDMNRIKGVTTVVVTHYEGVAQFVERVVHIRDGRISSETVMEPGLSRSGQTVARDYVVVDRVGRLQIPFDYFRQGRVGKRVKMTEEGGQLVVNFEENDGG